MKDYSSCVVQEQKASKIFRVITEENEDSREILKLIKDIQKISFKTSQASMIKKYPKSTKETKNNLVKQTTEEEQNSSETQKLNPRRRKFRHKLFPKIGNTTINETNLVSSLQQLQNTSNIKITENSSNLFPISNFYTQNISKSPYSSIMNQLNKSSETKFSENYIFFIAHGLDGNPFDMRHIRAAILTFFPEALIFIISTNYGLTAQTIENQAIRVANEIETILVNPEFFSIY